MRYLLIVLGLLVALLGIYLTLEMRGHPGADVGPPITVIGGLALVAGVATCEIMDAIRERRP
jgi:uncharacterized membrane protein